MKPSHKVLNRSIQRCTPEQVATYKIHEVVLCRGVQATIRDIYTRTFRYEDENGDDQFGCHLSYRMHEKEFQAIDVPFEDIQKLNGDVNFQNKPMPKNIRLKDL